MHLSTEAARELVEATMNAAGYTEHEAAVISDHLIDCELRGLGFGGLARAISVLEKVAEKGAHPAPISLVRDAPFAATVDGGNQVGYLVAARATDLAISKATSTGVAVVGAYNTWYTGMFSYYLERLAEAGLVALIAGSAPQKVAPFGSNEGRFGTNPIGVSVPARPFPMIWDMGTSRIMAGEVALAARLDMALPAGVAYAADGEVTRDARAAAAGAFAVWGGHKGSGLALGIQMLGMLAGAAADPVGLSDCGFLVIAINPGTFGDSDDYVRRVSSYLETVRASRPLQADAPIRIPFERSARERAIRRQQNNLEVADEVYRLLLALR